MKILVTGATGFVGSALINRLIGDDVFSVRIALRKLGLNGPGNLVDRAVVGDLESGTDWRGALEGVQTVVHLAARVHVMQETSTDSLAEFRKVNVESTVNLARQAIAAGVRRFVFVSSIKVNGESTLLDQPFHADDILLPIDPYGISKYEAELELQRLASESEMELVIIRPPLVYGPGVKANFQTMIRSIWQGIPLPFGAITDNKRSLVFIDNLVDFVVTCINHPGAANQTFLVSDDEDLSTASLFRRMGGALGRPARLLSVPIPLLKFGATLLAKPDLERRLCGSLQVDISKAKDVLGWSPRVGLDEGLRHTALHWIESQRKSSD